MDEERDIAIGYPMQWGWPLKGPAGALMNIHSRYSKGFSLFPSVAPTTGSLFMGLVDLKLAFSSTISIPAVFAEDVCDGDLVKPVLCDVSAGCKELIHTMKMLPDAIWIPSFRPPYTSYRDADPVEFWGVALLIPRRVAIGPIICHPRFRFHTGDKVYADNEGKYTTTQTNTFVGLCVAPHSILFQSPLITSGTLEMWKKPDAYSLDIGYATNSRSAIGTSYAYTIPNGLTYTVGGNNLMIFYEGIKLAKNAQYTEVSSTQVRFECPIPSGHLVEFYTIGLSSTPTRIGPQVVESDEAIDNSIDGTWLVLEELKRRNSDAF